jgi:hypothetical protein
MLIPPFNNKPAMLGCKLLSFRQFPHFETLRLAQIDSLLYLKHGFTTTIPNVNMNGAVFVAVKKESVAVLLENLRHAPKLSEAKRKGDLFVERSASGAPDT